MNQPTTVDLIRVAGEMAALGFSQADIREERERIERVARRQSVHYADREDYLAALEHDGVLWGVVSPTSKGGQRCLRSSPSEPARTTTGAKTRASASASMAAANLAGHRALMHQERDGSWYCPKHASEHAETVHPDTVGGYLGNALAIWRLTNGNPNREELSRICTLTRRAALEARRLSTRLIEVLRYTEVGHDGPCPWDGLEEDEQPTPTPTCANCGDTGADLGTGEPCTECKDRHQGAPDLSTFRTEGPG